MLDYGEPSGYLGLRQAIADHAAGTRGVVASADQVIITSFADVSGSVFTGAGHPIQQPSPGGLPAGSYWIGQAMEDGTEIYMIEIKVTVGQLQPVQYYVWWNATLTAQ